jgi:tripartite-type tricarboxylate transporter receptor subunit TctC
MKHVFVAVLAAFGLVTGAPAQSPTDTYPSKPVKFIVPVPPGGAADLMARMIAEHLQAKWGQPFVVENKPGAGSAIGIEALARSPADGYTIGLGNIAANAINPAVQPDTIRYQPVKDFAAISLVGVTPLVLVVNADKVPAKTVPEFIAYAKANPGKINLASSGNGTSIHMSGELFKMMTGLAMQHVPYRGSAPMLTDLLAGQVQVTFDNMPSSIEHIRGGRLRALAVTTAVRSEALPDIPIVADFVPGYEASAWFGLGAPKGTPAEIIQLLNKEINAAVADPNVRARLVDMGGMMINGTPAEFGRIIAEETDKWAKVVKFSGAKPE